MPRETTQQLLKLACQSAGDSVQYRRSYSGRGMYSDACVGIVGGMTDCMAIIAEVIKAKADQMLYAKPADKDHAAQEFYETVDTLLQYETDDMGLDSIVYWPVLKETN